MSKDTDRADIQATSLEAGKCLTFIEHIGNAIDRFEHEWEASDYEKIVAIREKLVDIYAGMLRDGIAKEIKKP